MVHVATRPVKISGKTYQAGEVVPEEHLSGSGGLHLRNMGWINQVSASAVAGVTTEPEPKSPLERMSATEAKASVERQDDLDTLAEWRGIEMDGKERVTVVAAIDARIEAINDELPEKTADEAADLANADDLSDEDKEKALRALALDAEALAKMTNAQVEAWAAEQGEWVVVDETLYREQNAVKPRKGALQALEARLRELAPQEVAE